MQADDERRDRDCSDEGAPSARAPVRWVAVAKRFSLGLLAAVGALAILSAGALGALSYALGVDGRTMAAAQRQFHDYALSIPGVTDEGSRPGVADIGTAPSDIYSDVHLEASCTFSDVSALVQQLQKRLASNTAMRVHPVLWCRKRGIGVSPIAPVDAARMAVYRRLEQDDSLTMAAVYAPQPSDDPAPDTNNDEVIVALLTSGTNQVGATAGQWSSTLHTLLPAATLEVGQLPQDTFQSVLQTGYAPYQVTANQRWLQFSPAGTDAAAFTRVARRLDANTATEGYLITSNARVDQPAVDVLVSTPEAVASTAQTLATSIPTDAPVRMESAPLGTRR